MRFETLLQQLEQVKRAPVERWSPDYCGQLDIYIDKQGRWFHENKPILRKSLVALFAQVLVYEKGTYYLVTPAEKIAIQVEDLPFLITQWQQHETEQGMAIQVQTNLGESYLLSQKYPLFMDKGLPAVRIRSGLLARVHRNVYYQWSEQLIELVNTGLEPAKYILKSGPYRFLLEDI